MSNRIPPADMDAEKAVLSAAILDPGALDEAMGILAPEHFYSDAHGLIWRAIRELAESDRKVDTVTLVGLLRDQESLDRVGGVPAIAEIVDATPSVANVEEHAKIVRDKWRKRELIAHCQKTIGEAYAEGLVDDLLSDHTLALDTIADSRNTDTQVHVKDALRGAVEAYNYRSQRKGYIPGIPTGLHSTDLRIGGLGRGNLYVVAARPGAGKTGYAISVALFIAALGYGVVIISMEMPRDQLVNRMAAQIAQIDIKEIGEGRLSAADMSMFSEAVARISNLPIVIDDDPTQTPTSLRASIRRGHRKLKKTHPDAKLGLVAVDYLQLMEDPTAGNREQEVSRASKACRKAAKTFHVPVMALSQLNRKVEDRKDKRPNLGDLRESGAIEQDAFGILFLYREDMYRERREEPDGMAEIIVGKLRQGGQVGYDQCKFHGPSSAFFDLQGHMPDRDFHNFD